MTENEMINGWTFKETVQTAENLMEVEKNMFKWDVLRHLRDFAELYREQLKEYQQLEEQGRLIKLPCKVGDTVYRITDGMIQEFEINKFVVSYSIFNNEATVYMYFAGGHGGCSIDFYGVSVFGTQTEAEAKLKELRGEQNDGE